MKRQAWAAGIILAVIAWTSWAAPAAFSRDDAHRGRAPVDGLLLAGNANFGMSVGSFPAPTSFLTNVPISFGAGMTISNAGPDADEALIIKTLAVPVGCTGNVVGSLNVTGADTAVVFSSLPSIASSGSAPNSDTVSIECQTAGFHTFTFRAETQPLFATDATQSNNVVTIPFTICDVDISSADPDGDGQTNTQEALAGTNPCNADTDGDTVLDGTDNCGLVPNLSQANTDSGPPPPATNSGGIGNGPSVPGNDVTVPNGDAPGDACDPDLDNDGLPNPDDGATLSGCGPFNGAAANHPNPTSGDVTYNDNNDLVMLGAGDNGPSWDTDGDTVLDGVECSLGTNPRAAVAGDMGTCSTFAGGSADSDGDGISNAAEVCKWGTSPGAGDTDGDGLGDCHEIMDVNGNKLLTASDSTLVLQALFGLIGNDGDFDINGNGFLSASDSTLIRQAIFGLIPCS